MTQRTKNESKQPDSTEQEMLDELQNALNRQFSATFVRVQNDYGHVGARMADSANAITDDQDFIDFLFGFYDGIRVLLEMPIGTSELWAYPQVLSHELFLNKWQHGLTINVPCHVEEVLAGDRYLRRFLREFFLDTYKAKMEAKNHQKQ